MIILIDENKNLKEFIDEANFSAMGVLERTHLEEWISERPDILGDKLKTITTEFDGFDKTNKRLDILAVDSHGKLVVIELKRDIAETFVDLQAIHYAAYCSTLTLEQISEIYSEYSGNSKDECETEIIEFISENNDFKDFDNQPRIVIVANNFKEETLAAVLWLRDIGADITCVKLEAYELNNQIVITPDIIIPLPEAEQYMVYKAEKTKVLAQSPTTEFTEFWRKILTGLREINPEIPEKRPYKGSYFPFFTKFARVHFEWMVRKRPSHRFMVCLHFENDNKEINEKFFNYFLERENEIRQKLPEIRFDDRFNEKLGWMQIYIQRDSAELDDENIKWGIKTMDKFYRILNPILNEINLE